MPGIDAALARLNTGDMPQQVKVNYNGWDGEAKQKKPVVSEATIDPAAEGMEKCRKLMADQEAKIKKMQDKINGVAPTKKNKAEISALKEQLQGLQYDGNYRAALVYVRKREDEERDARREERERQEQLESEAIDGVARKAKGAPASSSSSAETKKKEVAKPARVDDGPFECDTEVVAVVQSAVDGSEDAQGKLRQGAGATRYTSEVRAEVASIAFATRELLSAKLKRAPTRPQALATIKSLLWHSPAVLPALPAILTLLDEAKLKLEAANLALEVAKAGPSSRGVPELVIPVLLAHLGTAAGGKWQIKVGTMGVLKNVLPLLVETCPKQLGWAMPKVMASMRDAASDARKEVRREAEAFLKHMGQEMVGTPEIKGMVDGIVGSLVDSANMEKATEIMSRLANTTFLNAVDSCSFGLLFPIVSRSMRERTHEAKTRGVQIMGASVDLIADPEFLHPYVEELMPLLKDCLLDPNASVQREAAKSLGSLAVGLPSLCEEDFYPFLLEKLKNQDVNEDVSEVDRRGAAHGLAEVLLHRMDLLTSCLQQTILPQISKGSTKEAKAGGLVLFTFLPHLGPQAFLPHLPRCLPVILDALTEDSEVIVKQAMAAARVIIEEYGSAYPRLLMGRLQEALFFEDEEARDRAMELFYAFCEKVTETLNFGQDFLSMEVLPQWHRHSLLSSIYIAQRDGSHSVKRQATLLWKERLQSGQKAKAEILPHLLQVLRGLQLSEAPSKQAAAKACLPELLASGEASEEALQGLEPQGPALGADAAAAAAEGEEEALAPPPPRGQLLQRRCATSLASVTLPAPLRSYVEAVVTSCCVEAHTRASAEEALEAELLPISDKKALEKAGGSAIAAFGLTAALGQIFEGVADESSKLKRQTSQDADGNVLVRADNLLMMYGGGKILLKNATLELLRGHRYGVVGRNGAGKTTLMQQIANGGVKQMSGRIKTLHVRPEVLIEASELTAVQFCQRDLGSQKASEESLEAALQKVGFPKEMQAKSVNELSGGWRMKLLLASAMMRECDILLLDEPTNHLDKESVAWLSQYLVSLTGSSLMVISHDPHFLNSVCTDIIQYSAQRTLEYYSGNFADFLKAKEINSEEEAEALLLGQDVEEKAVEEKEAVHQEDEVTGLTASALDKQSKISFPIPGKLQGHSPAKPVVELKNVSFAYNEEEGPMVLKGINCKLTLASRVGIVGANGAGKSTLLNIICGELMPSIGPGCSTIGEVVRHRNLRLAYIAQQHMFHLGEFLKSSPYIYIQKRFKNGWDEALQKRLVEPANAEEAQMRKELAARWGKYGNQVAQIVGRVIRGNEVVYEVQWENLDDPKQNTFEPYTKLKTMGVACLARAYDERTAAQSAGIDQRPLSQREIVKHLEQFGLNEDQVLNQEIGSFSAGQKSKLTLGAAFWTRPHVVALDEPTNYIDMETLDALAKGLARFKGGLVVISHASDFVDRVCNETWLVEGATIASVAKNSGDKKA